MNFSILTDVAVLSQSKSSNQQSVLNEIYEDENGPREDVPLATTSFSVQHIEKLLTCMKSPQCHRHCCSLTELAKHLERHTCSVKKSSAFSCSYCGKPYNSSSALKMHIRTHTLPCVCAECGKAFSRAWLLRGHMRTHTGEKPYACNKCGRCFADRSNLRAHIETHQKTKNHTCSRCKRPFCRAPLLHKHMRHCNPILSKSVTF